MDSKDPIDQRAVTAATAPGHEFHSRFSRRLQLLTLGIGFSAAIAVIFLKSFRAGAGVAAGAVLAWLNYRWLEGGVGALIAAGTRQEGAAKPRVPAGVYVKFAGR
jgi:hypothetical protein